MCLLTERGAAVIGLDRNGGIEHDGTADHRARQRRADIENALDNTEDGETENPGQRPGGGEGAYPAATERIGAVGPRIPEEEEQGKGKKNRGQTKRRCRTASMIGLL